MSVVIFEPTSRLLVHQKGTLRVPEEVIEQAEEEDLSIIVSQWARKLHLLDHGEHVRQMP